jgi:hypothetical protein
VDELPIYCGISCSATYWLATQVESLSANDGSVYGKGSCPQEYWPSWIPAVVSLKRAISASAESAAQAVVSGGDDDVSKVRSFSSGVPNAI